MTEAIRNTVWWHPYQVHHDVEILHVDLSPDPHRERVALDLLNAAEKVRYRRFLVEDARRQFLLARGALRLVLATRLDISPARLSFAAEENGKPYATIGGAPASVSFNLSHSGDTSLIALTPARSVGIDLEQRRTRIDVDGVSSIVFGDRERAALARLDGASKMGLFYRLWTCKEALLKARGTGMRYDPVRFEVPGAILAGHASARFGFPDEAARDWQLIDLGSDAYAAALAYRR